MKQLVSHRLDSELLAWATSYAKSRGTSRAVVIEAGLSSLRSESEGGVPDLPVVDSPEVRVQRVAQAEPQRVQHRRGEPMTTEVRQRLEAQRRAAQLQRERAR